ncbi:MAG: tryptophan synthase subunit alpha [Sporolactobacillus sp.]
MNRMATYVAKKNKMLFIPFIVAGDPTADATVDLALMLQNAGADAIELGIPYSDPLADGPVIQRASKRALTHQITLLGAMRLVKAMRQAGLSIPVIIFTYANPLYQLGQERFFKEAAENEIDGLLVPDLPFEESEQLATRCRQEDVALISLVAPTTSDVRLAKIAAAAQGFIYCVSSLGVTGVRHAFHPAIFSFLTRVRAAADCPIAVGFGISSHEQVEDLSDYADGFIVGSAIVREVETHAAALAAEETRPAALDAIRAQLEQTLLRAAPAHQ